MKKKKIIKWRRRSRKEYEEIVSNQYQYINILHIALENIIDALINLDTKCKSNLCDKDKCKDGQGTCYEIMKSSVLEKAHKQYVKEQFNNQEGK